MEIKGITEFPCLTDNVSGKKPINSLRPTMVPPKIFLAYTKILEINLSMNNFFTGIDQVE